MEMEGKNQRVFRGPERDFPLQWGNRKRLRCVKVREGNTTTASGVSDNNQKRTTTTTTRINRRFLKFDKDFSSSNRVLRDWESWGSESRRSSHMSSPEKEENRFYSTRGSTAVGCTGLEENKYGNGNSGGGGEEKGGKIVLPRFFISLSSKEKEEDFMAMKGCKLPQRPKKRAKLIQRTILLVSPGAWLSDLSQERYEVREKKSSRKRKRGLKAMSMESDSE